MKQRKLNSLNELIGEFDLIINCTGLGARDLCNDKRLVSLRGQVIKVRLYIIFLIHALSYQHDSFHDPFFHTYLHCTFLLQKILYIYKIYKRIKKSRIAVTQVKAPWIKTFFYGELDTYVIPGFNGTVTLGGSRNFDCENTKLCRYESAAIRERCETLVPSLRNAEVVREEIGFRPHREGNVRVEVDRVSDHCSKAIVSIFGN